MKASIGIAIGTFALLFGPLVSSSIALQPDGPFLAYKERKAGEWAKDDEQITAKLDGLQKRFGAARVFDTLLDEQSILGLAIGAGDPVVDPGCSPHLPRRSVHEDVFDLHLDPVVHIAL